jgi:hypothetical protein
LKNGGEKSGNIEKRGRMEWRSIKKEKKINKQQKNNGQHKICMNLTRRNLKGLAQRNDNSHIGTQGVYMNMGAEVEFRRVTAPLYRVPVRLIFQHDELERIWKESAVTQSRYYHGICLEGLSKKETSVRTAVAPAEIRT